MRLSFHGGGWTLPYLVGLVCHLQQVGHVGHDDEYKYMGVSSGACVALAAALSIPMPDLMDEILVWAALCRKHPSKTCVAVAEIFRTLAPAVTEDAIVRRLSHESNPLCIVTGEKVPGRPIYPVVYDHTSFTSYEVVMRALVGSCTIPYVNAHSVYTFAERSGRRGTVLDGMLAKPYVDRIDPFETTITVSTNRWKRASDFAYAGDLTLTEAIIPQPRAQLLELYEHGKRDGPALVEAIRQPPAAGMRLPPAAGIRRPISSTSYRLVRLLR